MGVSDSSCIITDPPEIQKTCEDMYERCQEIGGPDYNPRIHVDLYGTLGELFSMPVLDGLAATRRLRKFEQFAHVPIIALSADAFTEQREIAFAAGVALDELLARLNIPAENTAYMGDDVVDIPALRRAALALTVQDAHPDVIPVAHWRSRQPGGRGAVREACDLLLSARGARKPD